MAPREWPAAPAPSWRCWSGTLSVSPPPPRLPVMSGTRRARLGWPTPPPRLTKSTTSRRGVCVCLSAGRRACHQRLRSTLGRMTGTRSFHQFCPHFAPATKRRDASQAEKGSASRVGPSAAGGGDGADGRCVGVEPPWDPRAVRSVYRCRAGLTAGWHDQRGGGDFAVLTLTGRSFLYHLRNIRMATEILDWLRFPLAEISLRF
jgi:hypothetical protein